MEKSSLPRAESSTVIALTDMIRTASATNSPADVPLTSTTCTVVGEAIRNVPSRFQATPSSLNWLGAAVWLM